MKTLRSFRNLTLILTLSIPAVSFSNGLAPKESLKALEVAEGMKVELFASEPMLLSPSSRYDHKGRVWVAEIVNYRGHNGKRPEGDRFNTRGY